MIIETHEINGVSFGRPIVGLPKTVERWALTRSGKTWTVYAATAEDAARLLNGPEGGTVRADELKPAGVYNHATNTIDDDPFVTIMYGSDAPYRRKR